MPTCLKLCSQVLRCRCFDPYLQRYLYYLDPLLLVQLTKLHYESVEAGSINGYRRNSVPATEPAILTQVDLMGLGYRGATPRRLEEKARLSPAWLVRCGPGP
jgi:hypothetical protein